MPQSLSPGAVRTDFGNNFFTDNPNYTPAAMQAAFAAHINFPILEPKDIADAVLYVIGAPAHVSIHELIIAPTEQPAM